MSVNKAVVLENIPFTIDQTRVLREMRVSRLQSVDEIEEKPLAESIKKAIDKAYTLIHGKGVFKTYAVTGVKENMVSVEGADDLFTGGAMVKLLGNCDFATLMACTIGSDLETEVERLQGLDEIMDAYNLEMVGGWMADYMADRVDERIEREIVKLGYGRSMRYSPGYGDWSLEKQPAVLKFAEADRIGISLTDSNIMIPRKSVSAVIGWVGGEIA